MTRRQQWRGGIFGTPPRTGTSGEIPGKAPRTGGMFGKAPRTGGMLGKPPRSSIARQTPRAESLSA